MKQFITTIEGRIRIDYRCPKCRSCSSCRNALETEKISLREEAEEAEIRASVQLDFKNKMFKCGLPLRGKIEDFLTSNRPVAEKILERQCKLYGKVYVLKKQEKKFMSFQAFFRSGNHF